MPMYYTVDNFFGTEGVTQYNNCPEYNNDTDHT